MCNEWGGGGSILVVMIIRITITRDTHTHAHTPSHTIDTRWVPVLGLFFRVHKNLLCAKIHAERQFATIFCLPDPESAK